MSSPLIRLAQRVGREPFFLGHHLATLRSEYAHSFAEQAAAFGLEPEALAKLALCRMPATAEDLAAFISGLRARGRVNINTLLASAPAWGSSLLLQEADMTDRQASHLGRPRKCRTFICTGTCARTGSFAGPNKPWSCL